MKRKTTNRPSLFKWILSLSILAATGIAQGKTITVSNQSGEDMWVTIAAQQVIVSESEDGMKVHREFEQHYKFNNKSSVGVEGVAEVSQEIGIEVDQKRVNIDESFKSRKFAWSPFITAGEEKITNGRSTKIEIPDSAKIYYLTIRKASGILSINSPKSATKQDNLTVDTSGFASPTGKQPILGNSNIVLKAANGKYLSIPISSKGYPAGNHGASASAHEIGGGKVVETTATRIGATTMQLPTKWGPIYSGEKVTFYSRKTTHDGYHWLYQSTGNWTYYDSSADRDEASYWIIKKVTSDNNDTLIRDGDQVLIQNAHWGTFHLDTREDGRWVTCTDGTDPVKWTISLVK